MHKIVWERIGMNNKFINIILIFITLALLFMDALAIYDIIMGESDLFYEIGMVSVSILVFIAIGIYLKQRKQKATQLQ
jgi:hypothetical protein